MLNVRLFDSFWNPQPLVSAGRPACPRRRRRCRPRGRARAATSPASPSSGWRWAATTSPEDREGGKEDGRDAFLVIVTRWAFFYFIKLPLYAVNLVTIWSLNDLSRTVQPRFSFPGRYLLCVFLQIMTN